jgi:hypothetical protein
MDTYLDDMSQHWVELIWPRARLNCCRAGPTIIALDDYTDPYGFDAHTIGLPYLRTLDPGVRDAIAPIALTVAMILEMPLRDAWALSWSLR